MNNDVLLKFFRLSVAAFDFADKAALSIGKPRTPSEIENMHRKVLAELEKEEPDEFALQGMLDKIEDLTRAMALAKKAELYRKFAPGGVSAAKPTAQGL